MLALVTYLDEVVAWVFGFGAGVGNQHNWVVEAGALLGGPPGSAAANATIRRLRGQMEQHGVQQLTGGTLYDVDGHGYASFIDRGR